MNQPAAVRPPDGRVVTAADVRTPAEALRELEQAVERLLAERAQLRAENAALRARLAETGV